MTTLSSTFIPKKLTLIISKYTFFKQNIYDSIINVMLSKSILKNIVICYHKFLFLFRIYSVKFFDYLDTFIPIKVLMIFISLFISKLGLASYLIIFAIIFISIDFRTLTMLRYYKKYPLQLNHILFAKRDMWSSAQKIVQEAASNPQVQAVTAAVVGALAWKTLDVYDVSIQRDIANQDRESAEKLATQEREQVERMAAQEREQAEKIAAADRESAEKIQQQEIEMRRLELEETRQSRFDENQRHKEEMAMREKELEKEHAKK